MKRLEEMHICIYIITMIKKPKNPKLLDIKMRGKRGTLRVNCLVGHEPRLSNLESKALAV